jgi:hypothetical protein
MASLTAEFFARAGLESELSERMSFAHTTVHIHFIDGDEEAGCTVWLDRTPISAEVGFIGDVEVELFGSCKAFTDMITGKEAMAMLIARGEVTYTGPVRKFLRVVPILRTFDFAMWRDEQSPTSAVQPGAVGPSAIT